MAFRAKFPGRCATCGGSIEAGDLISGSTRRYSHVRCLAAEDGEAPAAEAEAEQILAAQAARDRADQEAWEEFLADYVPRPGEGEFSL